jgi:hypothetical protein
MKKTDIEKERLMGRRLRQKRYSKKITRKLISFNLTRPDEQDLYIFVQSLSNFSGTVKRLLKEEKERLETIGKDEE